MDFSEALNYLKQGGKLKRKGWNGQFQYVKSCKCEFCGKMFVIVNIGTIPNTVNIWVPSISDLFADDWEIYKGE